MDLTNEILRFSSILQEETLDPLRDGLRFYIVDEALSPPVYNDTESTTTVDGVDISNTYKAVARREIDDEVEPGTPSSQATVSIKIAVEGWPARRRELGLEIERLSMWKFDVRGQGVDTKFDDHNNPLHTIIRRSLVNIAHVLVDFLFKPLIPHHTLTRYLLALKTESTSPESQLGEACKKLRHKLEQSRASIQSITFDEDDRPYPQTRSRQSSFGISSDDLDVLGNLRDNIDRLGYVLSGLLVKNNAPTSLGKRLRRKSSLEGDDDKIDRKKLYNGPQLLSQLPEELEDSLATLEQSISDIKSLWDATATLLDTQPHQATSSRHGTITLTLSGQVGEVSTLLDFAMGHESKIVALRSAFRVALGDLGLITVDKELLNDESIPSFSKPLDDHSGGRLRDLTSVLQVGEVLSGLPTWRIHNSTKTSNLINSVVTSTWLSLLEELLLSLRYILQHLVESNTTPTFYPDNERMTHLQQVFEQYIECQTRPRLEGLIAIRRSATGILKKLHQSASDAIRSLHGRPEPPIEATAWSSTDEEHGHLATADFDTGTHEQAAATAHVKPRLSSPIQSFTICITEDSDDQPLCQKSLDDHLA